MNKKNLDFLFEIGALRKVNRAWQQVMSGDVQNVSEHIFRTTMIAWLIAVAEKADVNKVLKICLIHDIAESRTGDIAFMHRDYVKRNDELAEADIFRGTLLENEARELFEEYNQRKSLEAKIVKDADNLDVDLELKELSRIGDSTALRMQKDNRPIVRQKKLYTKTAKKMWDEIKEADPNEWHQALTNKWLDDRKSAQ